MAPIDEMLHLVDRYANSRDIVGPMADNSIKAAERRLGVVFPPRYRRYVERYGSADVGPEEFFGLTNSSGRDQFEYWARGAENMRDLKELHLNEGGSPVTTPAPTPRDVERLEEWLGSRLPPPYVDFLMFSNGGHPELDTFTVEVAGVQQDWAVDRFFSLTSQAASFGDLGWYYNHRWRNAPPGVVPIARDGGGNLICLDLSKPDQSPVALWVHDAPGQPLLKVSDSFEEFIDALRVNPDYV